MRTWQKSLSRGYLFWNRDEYLFWAKGKNFVRYYIQYGKCKNEEKGVTTAVNLLAEKAISVMNLGKHSLLHLYDLLKKWYNVVIKEDNIHREFSEKNQIFF